MFAARRSTIGDRPVLIAFGELDLSQLPAWHSALHQFVADHAGERTFVDLDEVTLLDDSALGVLLGSAGRARAANGDVVIVCTNQRLLARLEITRLDQAIDVRTNTADERPLR
jgi:anti-sigma B factor antagonist